MTDLASFPPYYQLQPLLLDKQLEFWKQRILDDLILNHTHLFSLQSLSKPVFNYEPQFDLVNRILDSFSEDNKLEKVNKQLYRIFSQDPILTIANVIELGIITSIDEIKDKLYNTQLRELVNEPRFYQILQEGEKQGKWKCSKDRLGRVDGIKL